MSDFERAAAEHLRRQRELSTQETAAAEAAKQAHAREQQLLRDRAREFFAFARHHGAPLLRRYIVLTGSQEYPDLYKRTDDLCVVAHAWHDVAGFRSGIWRWAVREDGTVYPDVWEASSNTVPKGVRDKQYFGERFDRASDIPRTPHLTLADHFAPAAAALLEPLPLANGVWTGVQASGWIGYRLT